MINDNDLFKLTRLFVTDDLADKAVIPLQTGQAHYLHNVMRKKEGEHVRLFNGQDGEWLGTLQSLSKKSGEVGLIRQTAAQPTQKRRLHLFFPPIKKNRQDWLIEKAVELGVTDFHPILTQNTQIHKINAERVAAQIFEASEQCERFVIPTLHGLQKLNEAIGNWPKDKPFLSCIERYGAQAIPNITLEENQDIAFLIGPEGGFTSEEKEQVAQRTTPVTLGETVLRVETAAIKALILLNP